MGARPRAGFEASGPAEYDTPGSAHPAAALIERLGRRVAETVAPLVPPGEPLALLDFPHSPNVGDSVIWLGTLAFLRSAGRPAPRYTCSNLTYMRELLARRLPHGTILLAGGGNFGDLYESHQRLREEVVRAFPEHRIVQLPQTIHFRSTESLARARRAFEGHPDLTLLVRDHASLELARNEFRAPSQLCPDMAFCLGPLPRPAAARCKVVWLSRQDRESAGDSATLGDSSGGMGHAPPAPAGIERVDWPGDRGLALLALYRLVSRQLRRRRALRAMLQAPLSLLYEPVARARVARGCRILSAGRRAICDRLHGHILCLLLGIPHFLLDNSYGKVRRFHEAWTRDCELVRWCDSAAEALRLAAGDPP